MSYILDALKKSEHERKQGKVPGLHSFHLQSRPAKSTNRLLLTMAAGTMLFASITLGLWVFFRQPAALDQDPPPVREQVAEKEPQPLVTKPRQDPAVSGPVSQSAEVIGQGQPASRPENGTSPPVPMETGPNQTTDISVMAEATVVASDPANHDLAENPDHENPFESADNSQDQDAGPKRKLTAFNKLPSDVRDALPELVIAAHYYANNPSARMASINGRVMRQGQSLGKGLVVDEIVLDGVIFSFHDYRFVVKVFAR